MNAVALAAAAASVLALLAFRPGGEARAQAQAPGPTLAAVKARDVLACGTSTGAAGFSLPDSRGVYRGIDTDLCRAVAAAVLGDAAKVRWVPLTTQARLPALQSGQIDVLIRTVTWTQGRDTANGLNFTAVSFFDGQGFMLRRSLNVNRAVDLGGAAICVVAGSTNELNLSDWARGQQRPLHARGVRAERRGPPLLLQRPLRRLLHRRQPARRPPRLLPQPGGARDPARHHQQGAALARGAPRRRPVVRHRPLDLLRPSRPRRNSASPRPTWTRACAARTRNSAACSAFPATTGR